MNSTDENMTASPPTPTSSPTPSPSPSLTTMLTTLTIGRVILNMTRRFTYAFIPEISRFFGVPLAEVQNIVALQAGVGVTSPFFGGLSERFGRKRILMVSMAFMSVAGFIGALIPQLWMFSVMMVVFGIGKVIFDPALQAYIGDRVPYARRGFAIGVTELGWSGALLIAAPLFGFILAFSNLQAVLFVLGLLLASGVVLIWWTIPPDHQPKGAPRVRYVTLRQFVTAFRRNPAALGGAAVAFLTAIANEVFFINYGVFMERSFNLELTALGTVTIVIAAAEIIGEFAVIGLSDRIGKRRLALMGMMGAALMYLVIPSLTNSLPLAMFAVFLMFLGTEIGIVSAIPVYTEIMPKARAVMISAVLGAASLGRLTGAVLGGILLSLTGSFFVIGMTSLVVGLVGIGIFWLYVRENLDGEDTTGG